MDNKDPLLQQPQKHVPVVTAQSEPHGTGVGAVATRDHDLIRQWAARRQAEPATGEATDSGPGVIDVNDGGPGIRFNFPGVGRYRPISWDEWFDNFDRHQLTFVYEDRLEEGGPPSGRYRIVKAEQWQGQID